MTERICVSCRTIKNREYLVKITKLKSGEIILNPSSKQTGRSLHVCRDKNCIEKLMKSKKIGNYLKTNSSTNIEETIKNLGQYIETNLP